MLRDDAKKTARVTTDRLLANFHIGLITRPESDNRKDQHANDSRHYRPVVTSLSLILTIARTSAVGMIYSEARIAKLSPVIRNTVQSLIGTAPSFV
jgi:hypothetical protein